jgi:hypothetical protein
MTTQGKRPDQQEDSYKMAAFAVIGLIVLIVVFAIVEFVKNLGI